MEDPYPTGKDPDSKVWVCWAAANGGVTNRGLRGVWPPSPEIGRNRPFSPFFCLFRPFPEGWKSTLKTQKTEEKGLFPQISSDLLKPPSLKPPFAALQVCALFSCLRNADNFGGGNLFSKVIFKSARKIPFKTSFKITF